MRGSNGCQWIRTVEIADLSQNISLWNDPLSVMVLGAWTELEKTPTYKSGMSPIARRSQHPFY